MNDRERLVAALARMNYRYMVVVHDNGSTIIASGSRDNEQPSRGIRFEFTPEGDMKELARE